MKILLLHGSGQNQFIFRSRLGSFRKLFKKLFRAHGLEEPEFVYLDAPFLVIENDETAKCWFARGVAFNVLESLLTINKYLKENSGVEGLIGFSQGGVMASLIGACHTRNMALTQNEENNFSFIEGSPCPSLKFFISISGFIPPHDENGPISRLFEAQEMRVIESLHVYGREDAIIDKKRSIELAEQFQTSQHIEHAGRHFVPTTAHREEYAEFVNRIKRVCD